MMKPNVDPFRCPLCGSSNKCGVAAGEKTCWCFSEPIPKGVLQRLPAEADGVACVCRACAMSHNALERALGQMAEVLRRR
jgi:hypothetical protein